MERARPLRRDRHLRRETAKHADYVLPGDDLPRARGLPAPVPVAVHEAVHQHDRGGRRAERRGAAGVGGRRGDRRAASASSPRASWPSGCSARSGSSSRRGGWSRRCCGSARRATASACAAAASTRSGCARARTGSSSPRASRRGVLRAARSATTAAGIHLCPPEIADRGRARLALRDGEDSRFPLRMIGLRELRSHNSWMHNSPKLMAGDRVHRARIHPDDAAAAGVGDGEPVRISSAARRDRDRGAGHRRGDGRDDRRPARLGPRRRLAGRERRRRREHQRARLLRARGPRAARRDGAPERDRGADRAGRGEVEPSEARGRRGRAS